VKAKVSSSRYALESEVVVEASLIMQHRDEVKATELDRLRGDIEGGLSSDPGKPWDAEAFKGAARRKERGS